MIPTWTDTLSGVGNWNSDLRYPSRHGANSGVRSHFITASIGKERGHTGTSSVRKREVLTSFRSSSWPLVSPALQLWETSGQLFCLIEIGFYYLELNDKQTNVNKRTELTQTEYMIDLPEEEGILSVDCSFGSSLLFLTIYSIVWILGLPSQPP